MVQLELLLPLAADSILLWFVSAYLSINLVPRLDWTGRDVLLLVWTLLCWFFAVLSSAYVLTYCLKMIIFRF